MKKKPTSWQLVAVCWFFLGMIHTYSVYVSLKSRNYFYIFLVGMSAKLFTLHFVKQVRNIYLACRMQNRYLNPLTFSLVFSNFPLIGIFDVGIYLQREQGGEVWLGWELGGRDQHGQDATQGNRLCQRPQVREGAIAQLLAHRAVWTRVRRFKTAIRFRNFSFGTNPFLHSVRWC